MRSLSLYLPAVLAYITCPAFSQATTGGISGTVRSAGGEKLAGATVQLLHEPTGVAMFTRTNSSGIYYFAGLDAGGPYTVLASFINHNPAQKKKLYVLLGETVPADLLLEPLYTTLQQVSVYSRRWGLPPGKQGISAGDIKMIPSAGRNLHDYLATLPEAKLVGGNEGAVSFAGQNNRYNALYIDGAVNNDLFGLAASGTNGGQAGIAPVPVEALEQLQVSVSPYDASLGNFTGAAVNAVTRSGTSRAQTSLYHFFRSTAMSGALPGVPKTAQYRKLYGIRTQGALIRNRLFYFANLELERNIYNRPFNVSEYTGSSHTQALSALAANLISHYGYDAGDWDHASEWLFADHAVMRIDWKPSQRHSFTFSARYTAAERTVSTISNTTTLYYSHAGYILNTRNLSGSFVWKHRPGSNVSHLLSATYTHVYDDRRPYGQPFPRVRIYDGEGSIVFGTDISSAVNLLIQRNSSFTDRWYFSTGSHRWDAGVDLEYSRVHNAFVQYAFGSYTYASLPDFITDDHPSGYQSGFSVGDSIQDDHISTAAKFAVMRGTVYINDAYRVSEGLLLHMGIRFDKYVFPNLPPVNTMLNDSVLPLLARYHATGGASSGAAIKIPVAVSPRVSLQYHIPRPGIIMQAGFGLFSGRMPFAWPGGVYQYNGLLTGGFVANRQQLNSIRLRPDAYSQWKAGELQGVANKDPVNLVAASLQMPAIARALLSVEKTYPGGWNISAEGSYTRVLSAIAYTNINLLPPSQRTNGQGGRAVYTDSNQARVPLGNGSNPYAYAILLHNREGQKGYGYEAGVSVRKQWPDRLNMFFYYRWGRSFAANDNTSSVNLSQWRTMESVQGRNDLPLSESDFSPGHRIFLSLSLRNRTNRKQPGTSVYIQYSGQSGWPFSYVYGGSSMVRDDGNAGGYELIYVPDKATLEKTIFLPLIVNNVLFTPAQQAELLENYFSTNRYLRKRRGLFAERNGSRTPFTHTVNLKVLQNLVITTGKKRYVLQLSCELINLANLICRDWGRKYLLPFDQLQIIDFAGYAGNTLVPQFRLNPVLLQNQLMPLSQSLNASYSSAWACQLGVRITF